MRQRRPAPGVLRSLDEPCRQLLHDRAAFDDHFLTVLDGVLAEDHPLRGVPGLALELLDVAMAAVLSGWGPEVVEAECRECGARCAEAGLPDDSFSAVGRALARAAREAAAETWTAAMSSDWAAVQLWIVSHLASGASRARARGEVWSSFPELAPDVEVAPSGAIAAAVAPAVSAASEWDLLEQAAGIRRAGPGPVG